MKTITVLGLFGLASASSALDLGRLSGDNAIQEDCEKSTSLPESLRSGWPKPTPSAYGDSDPNLPLSFTTTTTTLGASSTTSSPSSVYESQSPTSSLLITTTTTMYSFFSTPSSALPAYDSQSPPMITLPPYTPQSPHSIPIPHANTQTPQPALQPGSTPSSFFSTITVKTTMFTTICPTISIHVSNGGPHTSTHVDTTTVFSTYHVKMPCDECGSRNASSGVPDRATPPYPAGNSTVSYRPTFSLSSSAKPSTPPDSNLGNFGATEKPFEALMMVLLGVAVLLI